MDNEYDPRGLRNIRPEDAQARFHAAAVDAQRERITLYADDWRRLKSERAELLAALEAAWHRCRCAGGEQDCESCFEVRDLLARVRG